MIYKMFALVFIIVLFQGVKQGYSQETDCDYIQDILIAVEVVEDAADAADMRVPFGVTFQADRLEAICDGSAVFPCPAEVIIDRMTTIVTKLYEGTLVCPCWPEVIPEDFKEAIKELLDVLEGV